MEESPEVLMERIGNQHNSLHAMELRRKMLQGLLFAPMDAPNPEYVVITGCHGPFSLLHLAGLTNLLGHFGINFTFLTNEVCCGNSYLKQVKKGAPAEETARMEEYSVRSMKQNTDRAKELGTNKIITACAGCTTRYNHFFGDDESLQLLYYPQLLLQYLDTPELPEKVDFYEACHKYHRTPKYEIDIDSSRQLIGRIKGLEINEIPNICCMTEGGRKKIFEKSEHGTIVTPTTCCFAHMRAGSHRVKGPTIKPLTGLLCEAMGIQSTFA